MEDAVDEVAEELFESGDLMDLGVFHGNSGADEEFAEDMRLLFF
jgi:hypothetical protein